MFRKITYTDKEDILGLVSIDNKNKVTAQDMNDIKNAINDNTTELDKIMVHLAGDTMTGALNFKANTWNKYGSNVAVGAINTAGTLAVKGLDGKTTIRLVPNGATDNNGVTWAANSATDSTISGTLNGSFKGPLEGNAATTTKLQTARTINDTSFNGTANITTAKWGTARDITLGLTKKSVNGSTNIAWTLAEIGALPAAGGTMTGDIEFAKITTGARGIKGNLGSTDAWRIVGSTNASNDSYLEIATTNGGNEPIYIRQYTSTTAGSFGTVARTATILDASGNTTLPGLLTVNGIHSSKACTFDDNLTVKKNITGNGTLSIDGVTTLKNNANINGTLSVDGATTLKNTLSVTGALTVNGGITGSLTGNASTATKLATARTISLTGSVTGSGTFDGSGNLSIATTTNHTHAYLPTAGGTMTGDIKFSNVQTGMRGITGTVGDNDYWRVVGVSTASDAGYLEIATADGGDEPIYVRQYSFKANNSFGTITRTATILDASGNTTLPGLLTVNGIHSSKACTFDDNLTVKKNITGNGTLSIDGATTLKNTLSVTGASTFNNNSTFKKNATINGALNIDGSINSSLVTNTYLNGNKGGAIINSNAAAGAYTMLAKMNSTNGFFTTGAYQNKYLLQYTNKATVAADTNAVTKSVTLLDEDGNATFPEKITAKEFYGTFIGNSSTVTKLQTARKINDTSFDGTADITTTKWGTARNIYIADSDNTNTGAAVSVNGSGNATLKLPATIKASLTGNASSATKVRTPRVAPGNFNDIPTKERTIFKEYSDSSSNIPSNHWYYGMTLQGADINYTTQLALGMTTEQLHYRTRQGGNWGEWKKLGFAPFSTNVIAYAGWWGGGAAPYTCTISIPKVTSSNIVEVGLGSSANDDQVKACMKASIAKITQANGSITLYAYGTKPTVDIPLSIVVMEN